MIRLTDAAYLYHADMLQALRLLPDNCIDSVVTDPPYHLTSIVKRFGGANAAPAQFGTDGAFARASAGFMGKEWDGGDIAFRPETWAEVLRVLKPGGHVAAFGASRGYHRMACAIEDAGFEIRDSLMWVYGTGFPKSQNVAKFIDKELGIEGAIGEKKANVHSRGDHVLHEGWHRPWMDDPEAVDASSREYIPGSPEAQRFNGFGTALKPSHEPITVATKPLTTQQHFAILLDYLTDLLEEQTIWSGLSVHVAEQNFSAIRAKLDAVTKHTVLDSAKMRVLARFDPARFAEQNFIFHDPGFCVATKIKDDSVPSPARPSNSAASYLALTIPHGPADDLSIQLAGMCMSVITAGISENTVSSWVEVSDAILSRANTFTIETASRLTIALRTWNSLTSPNTIDGTGSLSPNVAPIVLARKPLSEGTVAANVLRWGTGALNTDGCRVPGESTIRSTGNGKRERTDGYGMQGGIIGGSDAGRWPANIVHDGSDEVVAAFPVAAGQQGRAKTGGKKKGAIYGDFSENVTRLPEPRGDSGSAARFFYSAKASKADRNGSRHPTVKPIALMEWLATLITPPGGTILDPFAGSGTTGAAARNKGFNCVLIEREAEYVEDIKRRFVMASPPLSPA